MSDKNKNQVNNNYENIKKFKSNCTNFIKMLSEEKSESIKINYLSTLLKLPQKLKITSEDTVDIIFKNILYEKTDILKSPSLLLAFISFCRKTNDNVFQNHFYDLLYKFLGDDENFIFFKEYLILFSLEIFFDSIKKFEPNEKDFESRQKFFNLLIHTDIKEFKDQFYKMIMNDKVKFMDNTITINFMINFFEIIILKNKYQIGIMLIKIIKEEIKNNNLPDEIIDNIINFENKNGFNSIIKKKKEINEFLTFNKMILENITEALINKENNESKLDIYLTNLLNILCIKKEFNCEIIKFIFDYFITKKYTILNKIFSIVIYYLSNFAYTNNQISFLFNDICKSKELNPIYKWILFKNPISYNKTSLIQTDFKPTLNDINIIIEMDTNFKIHNFLEDLINKALTTNEQESKLYLLIHLTLYDFIINSSFKCKEKNYNIDFYSLNEILELISRISMEKINKLYYNDFIQFLLDYLSVLFEFCISLKNNDNKIKIIIKTFNNFFNIFKKLVNNKDKQLSIVFPSLINILGNKNINIILLEPVIDYMIDEFSKITKKNDMIFKIIKGLLINKDKDKVNDKFFLANKLINLTIKSNEYKLFESLFSLCNELIKTKNDFDLKLNYYIINRYSKFYEGALPDLLQKYIIEKFDENFVQKKVSFNTINDDDYYIINTIDNIYLQDKPTNLKEIIDKFYADNYKKIIEIFDNLFEQMDKDENNKNIFKSNLKENSLIKEYFHMKKNIEDILDFYSYVKKYYDNDNNFKDNKKLYCIYGTSYFLIHLLVQYLSEKIENEKNIENEEEKKIENDKLMYIFDYIYEKVLLNKNIKNITFKSFFLNRMLANQDVLDYYFVQHTNNLVNSQIQEKQLDFSQLNQISFSINWDKSFGIIKLLSNNSYNIILINKLIKELFDYESNSINNQQKIDLYKKESNKYLIIKNIYTNKLFNKINNLSSIDNNDNNENNKENASLKNDAQMRINCCFSKLFFKKITDLSNIKNLESNQIYYLFCLDNEILNKYYSSFSDFFDFDYTILQFYSLIRNKNCDLELKIKFLEFLKNFIFIENINIFCLRSLSQEKTFQILISKYDKITDKEISLLNNIVISLFNNLINYNSYQNYTENVIIDIINNIFSYTNELLNLTEKNKNLNEIFNCLGGLFNFILEKFSTEKNIGKEAFKPNEKINSNLIKNINKFLENKINANNPNNNQELIKFIQSHRNINNNENNSKIMNYMDNNILIDNYLNNPQIYPFPIEQYIIKLCE